MIIVNKMGTSLFALTIGLGLASACQAQAQADDSGLQEIVVTAQKRSENVQNVPIAITAVDSARLNNTAASLSTVNIQQFVPGLVMGHSGTAGATFLRGVGSEAGTAGVESPVATYLDGIYLGVNALGVFELNNIDQISVLKGPQGTLFGRNATGGAIQITTKNPSLTKQEVKAEAGYGNYNTFTGRFYGSVPITPNLAANVSVLYKNRSDGTVRNIFTGHDLQAEKDFTIQGKILWQPTENDRLLVNIIHANGRDLPGLNYFVQEGALSQDGKTTYVGPHAVNLHINPYMRSNVTIGAITASHDFGGIKLTNTVAHTDFTNNAFNDQSMTTGLPNPANITPAAAHLDASIKETTDELQLQSDDTAKLKWIVGFFYFNDKTDTSLLNYNYNNGVPTFLTFRLNTRMGTSSYAGYAQATQEIFTNTNLTAGLRYTRDEKSFSGISVSPRGVSVAPNATVPGNVAFNKMTWRLALDHKFSDNIMGYASYNRGFRAGTYSATTLANPPARPETLDAYEVGVKSELFDRKLRLNLAGFYYRYSDLQLRQNISNGQAVTALILNAAKARIYGIDADFEARVTRQFRVYGGIEALKANYTSFPNGPANYPLVVSQLGLNPINAVPAGCSGAIRTAIPPAVIAGGHSNNIACDLSGNDMINAPRFSASFGVDYTMPTSLGDFVFSIGDKYTGKSYASPDNFQVLRAYHYVTASIGWTSTNDHFFGKLWVTNLNNSGRPAQEAFSLNTYEFLPNDPRFYGFTLGFKY